MPSLVVPETPVAVVEKGPATGPETSTVIAPAIEQLVAALEPVVEKVGAAESTATANEVSATTTLEPPAVEVLAAAETEMVVEESAILEEATIVEVPIAHPVEAAICPSTDMGQRPVSEENGAPALARTAANSAAPVAPKQWHGKRALMTALSRVLSTLSRWTRVRL
ncbi:MAG: hypothetical protein JWM82_1664 [Myxococcales bacterium]|nr:hypothetical protein [Myxococcales bacterium]